MNATDQYRRASDAHARANRRYSAALANAHKKPHLDLERAYLDVIHAEEREARLMRRMLTEEYR